VNIPDFVWYLAAAIVLVLFLAVKWQAAARRAAALEAKVDELGRQLGQQGEAGRRFHFFLMKVTGEIGFLSSNLPYDELVASIIRLVKDVIGTEFVGLYTYQHSSESLKLASYFGEAAHFKKIYLVGEGMVGTTAMHKMLLSRAKYCSSDEECSPEISGTTEISETPGLPDFTVPILFKEELLGVLSVGGISVPDGNEKAYLSMIAALAGISLRNALFINSARHEANTDALTGIYNRRFMLQIASEELTRARGYAYPFSVFMFDIDNFKNYNDNHGHAAGDRLLILLAEAVKKVTRRTSVFARYGGEEFIVLLPNIDKENAFLYGERVREVVRTYPFPHRETQPNGFVSVSGGVSSYPGDGDTVDLLIQRADAAMYESKKNGRNKVSKY
jgi:diguanylate cyclase (GGDEF)-like protein